jgi:hypothetical protein
MKKQVAVIALLIGTVVSQVSAQQQQVPQTPLPKTYPRQNNHTTPQPPEPRAVRYKVHDTHELPFGSTEWWRQMQREDKTRN